MKAAKTKEEIDAHLGKTELSADDLNGVSGGVYDPVNDPIPPEMKDAIIYWVKNGMRDLARQVLIDYGIDYDYYYYQLRSIYGNDLGVVHWIFDHIL